MVSPSGEYAGSPLNPALLVEGDARAVGRPITDDAIMVGTSNVSCCSPEPSERTEKIEVLFVPKKDGRS